MSNKTKVENSTTTTTAGTGTSTTTTASQWYTYKPCKAEQGWECPRCGRINAPWVRQCDCTRGTYDYDKWTITPTWDWWRTHVTCGQADANTYINKDRVEVGGSDYYNPSTKTWENVSGTQSNSTTYPPNCHTFNYSTPTKGD